MFFSIIGEKCTEYLDIDSSRIGEVDTVEQVVKIYIVLPGSIHYCCNGIIQILWNNTMIPN